jgi:hypothetical protein
MTVLMQMSKKSRSLGCASDTNNVSDMGHPGFFQV